MLRFAVPRLVILVALLVTADAMADDCQTLQLLGDNFDLSTEMTTQRRAPSVAFNSVDNQYLVIWFDTRNTGNNDIFGQRVAGDGALIDLNVPIMEFAESQVDPFVAHNSTTNQYLAAWKTQQPGYFNKGRGRMVDADGTTPTPDFLIGNGHETAIAYGPVANDFLHTARSPDIRGRRISAAGAPTGAELLIATSGAPAPNGGLDYDSNNDRFLSTWRDQTSSDLRGRVIASDGSYVTGPIIISPIFPASGRAASVAFDPGLDRHLVVFGMFQDNDLLAQFVTSNGALDGGNFTIQAGIPAPTDPYVAFHSEAEVFVVVWRHGNNIHAKTVAADGTVSNDVLIIATGTASGSPRLAYNSANHELLVVWSDTRNLGQGQEDIYAQRIACQGSTGISATGSPAHRILLHPARPNPFATRTTLSFTLAAPGAVRLSVWDVSGREVRELAAGSRPAGTHAVEWDGLDRGGRQAPSGVYFLRLEAASQTLERKVLQVR